MKRTTNLKVGTLCMIVLLALFGCARDQRPAPTASNPATEMAQINFTEQVSLQAALDAARADHLNISQVQQQFGVGKRVVTGMLPVSAGEDGPAIKAALSEGRRVFLEDLAAADPGMNGVEAVMRVAHMDLSNDIKQALSTPDPLEMDRISGLVVAGTPAQLEHATELHAMGILFPSTAADRESSPIEPLATSTAAATWVPRSGYIQVQPSRNAGQRYVQQGIFWDNVSSFPANSTYEADFFLNNSSGSSLGPGTYLDRSQTSVTAMPNVVYAASDFPRAYLDTRFSDGSIEIAYTIGCADGRALRSGYEYITYIRTRNGDASRDNAKASAQLGQRIPSWNYSTWGSFAVAAQTIVPAWSMAIPSAISWNRR